MTTTYVLDIATPLTMVIAETTGEDIIYYLHGLDLIAQSDGADTEYFLYDGLGSVRQLSNGAEHLHLTQTYDPYGSVYASVGAGSSSYGFTGEQVDGNGLVYLRARYYSASMGRFLNADPSRQEANPYQYSLSNPVMYTDPSGLWRFRQSTGLSGGNMGIIIHDLIENWYMEKWVGDMRSAMAEYGIPGTGTPPHPDRIDILNVRSGEVFEIKPITWLNSGEAQNLAMGYLGDLIEADNHGWLTSEHEDSSTPLLPNNTPLIGVRYNWNRSSPTNWSGNWRGKYVFPWRLGQHFPSKAPIAKNQQYFLFAGRGRAGEIFYWFEDRKYYESYDPGHLPMIRELTREEEKLWRRAPGHLPLRALHDSGVDVFDTPNATALYPYQPSEPISTTPIPDPIPYDVMCTPDTFTYGTSNEPIDVYRVQGVYDIRDPTGIGGY